jgi:hypothetical protein
MLAQVFGCSVSDGLPAIVTSPGRFGLTPTPGMTSAEARSETQTCSSPSTRSTPRASSATQLSKSATWWRYPDGQLARSGRRGMRLAIGAFVEPRNLARSRRSESTR